MASILTNSLKKYACCYLIDRYFGQFFLNKIVQDQLQFDSKDGSISVSDITLDCETLNEYVSELNLPIEIVYGFVGKITFQIPWSQVLFAYSHCEIKRLKLVFRITTPISDHDLETGSLLLESMLSSMTLIDSQNSSEYLRNLEQPIPESTNESVNSIRETLDAIFSRIKVTFKEIEIHLEQPPNNGLINSLEFNIEKIDYEDVSKEKLEELGDNDERSVNGRNDSEAAAAAAADGTDTMTKYLHSFKKIILTKVTIFLNEFNENRNQMKSHVRIGQFSDDLEVIINSAVSEELADFKFSVNCDFDSLLVCADPDRLKNLLDICSDFLFGNSSSKASQPRQFARNKLLTEEDNQIIEQNLQQHIASTSPFADHLLSQQQILGGTRLLSAMNYDDEDDSALVFYPMGGNGGGGGGGAGDDRMYGSTTSIADSLGSERLSSTASVYTSAYAQSVSKFSRVEEALSTSSLCFKLKCSEVRFVLFHDRYRGESSKIKYDMENRLEIVAKNVDFECDQKNRKRDNAITTLNMKIDNLDLNEHYRPEADDSDNDGDDQNRRPLHVHKLFTTSKYDRNNPNVSLSCTHTCKYSSGQFQSTPSPTICVITIDCTHVVVDFDLTIVDRIAKLLSLLAPSDEDSGNAYDDAGYQHRHSSSSRKSTVDLKIRFPEINFKFRLPSPSDTQVSDDFLLIKADHFRIKTTLGQQTKHCFKLELFSNRITVDYLDRPVILIESFLNAANVAVLAKIELSLNRRHAKEVPYRCQNPFHDVKQIFNGLESIFPDTHPNLGEFLSWTKQNTATVIHVTCPKLSVMFESKAVFDALYNRLLNDLTSWESNVQRKRRQRRRAERRNRPKFAKCRSRFVYDSDEEGDDDDDDDEDGGGGGRDIDDFYDDENAFRERAFTEINLGAGPVPVSVAENDNIFVKNDLCHFRHRTTKFRKCSVSIQVDVLNGAISLPLSPGKESELRLLTSDACFFLVPEYNGNSSLSYFTLEADQLHAYVVEDASAAPFLSASSSMAAASSKTASVSSDYSPVNIYDLFRLRSYHRRVLSPAPKSLDIFDQKHERKLITVCGCYEIVESSQKMLHLSVGVNEALFHYFKSHSTSTSRHWTSSLIDFFCVSDSQPQSDMSASAALKKAPLFANSYITLWNSAIDYRPINLPTKALITVDFFTLCVSFSPRVKSQNFKLFFEDCALFLSTNQPKDCYVYNFETDYVCLVDMDEFDLVLNLNMKPTPDTIETLVDLSASTKSIYVRTCSDSAAMLMELIVYFASDGDLKNPARTRTSSVASHSLDIGQHEITSSDSGAASLEADKLERATLLINDAINEEKLASAAAAKLPRAKSRRRRHHRHRTSRHEYDEGDKDATIESLYCDTPLVVTDHCLDDDSPHYSYNCDSYFANKTDSSASSDFDFVDADDHSMEPLHEPYVVFHERSKVLYVEKHFEMLANELDVKKAQISIMTPIFQYIISEVSLRWSIFGGSDFEGASSASFEPQCGAAPGTTSSPPESPSHAMLSSEASTSSSSVTSGSQNSRQQGQQQQQQQQQPLPLSDHSKDEQLSYGEIRRKGGANRNHEVQLEIVISKLRFEYLVFSKYSSIESRQEISIAQFEILDKLESSDINKFLYEYTSTSMPKQTGSNMLEIKAVHFRPELSPNITECSLKITLAPLRFNIDQETILFIKQFFTSLAAKCDDENTAFGAFTRSSPVHHSPVLDISLETTGSGASGSNNRLASYEDLSTSSNDNFTATESSADSEIFFKSIKFTKNVPIKLDYQGKHCWDMSLGKMAGLIMGSANLNNCEFHLRRICYRQGIMGFRKLISFLVDQWLIDIRNQLHCFISGVGPLSSILQILQGFRDLFLLPMEQYQRDGCLVRGIQRGTFSFSTSTALAFLELATKFISLLQYSSETAYDLLSAGPSIKNLKKKRKSARKRIQSHPQDIREGCHKAYLTVKEGLEQTAQDLVQIAAHEHEQKGYTGAVGGIIRQIPPTIVSPIIIASEAANNVLGGFKCQLVPDARLEANQKWRSK